MSPPSSSFRRYVRVTLLTMLAVGGLGALTAMVVDPYGIWRRMGVPHTNKPPLTWSRIAAAERLADDCDLALIGSSRVVFGFGTRFPAFGRLRLCNGALGGTSMMEMGKVVDFIVADTEITSVILFVDLHMFHDGRLYNHDFQQSRLNPDRTRLTYYAWSLTSLDAFEYTTKYMGIFLPMFTIPKRGRPSSLETRAMIKTTMLRDNMYRRFEGPEKSLAELERSLDLLAEAGIQMMVVIPAVHAMQLEGMETTGIWNLNKAWRRALTEITAKRDIPLWDFATYHSPAMSVLPLAPADNPNPWWSDMSHQSQMLGRLTLERIRDASTGKEGDWEPGFGVKLTPDMIEEHLAGLDEGRVRWRTEHPDQAAWYDDVVIAVTQLDPSMKYDQAAQRERFANGLPGDVPLPPRVLDVDLGEDQDLDF